MRRRAFLLGSAGAAAAVTWSGMAACATTQETSTGLGAEEHPLAGLTDMLGRPMAPPSVEGNVAILDFWASWCVPCRQAFRHLDQLYRTYQGDGLRLLAVSIDDELVAARRFWAAAQPSFPVAWDAQGAARARFSVLSLPTTILIDVDGTVVQRTEGFDLGEHRILEEQVHRLLRSV